MISPRGVGFKFALKFFAEKHYLKIIVCDVSYSATVNNVAVSLLEDLCNVKFTRINYKHVKLHDLVIAINEKLRLDDCCLLVLDNCSHLKPSQVKYLIEFLKKFNRKTGFVFRMTEKYLKKMKRTAPESYVELYNVTDEWGILSAGSMASQIQ